jgi:type VI secretion system protein ImpB
VAESTQKKLSRIRPPRVQVTYDLELGGAIQKKELPLVVGILADLAGKQENPLPPVKARKFVEIDRDNFNDVMASIAPRLAFPVDNRLKDGENSEDGGKLNVELRFRRLDDLRPESIVQQIEPLRKLFEARQRLNDLVGKLDGNDDLDLLLQDIAANTDSQQKIKEATKPEGGNTNG